MGVRRGHGGYTGICIRDVTQIRVCGEGGQMVIRTQGGIHHVYFYSKYLYLNLIHISSIDDYIQISEDNRSFVCIG